jgi:D-alanyl-D-alanine carboxypeptidase
VTIEGLMRKAIFAFVLAVCGATTLAASVPGAQADATKPAGLVVDAETGQILVANRANAAWYPASLTKLMTAYVVFSEVAAGKLSMDTQITVSGAAASQPPTKFGLKKGQKLTVKQALQAMLVTSANDAAVALAEQVSGSETGFAQRMNAAARRLGMISTRYQNATGLPNDGQVTTARDMAVLALAVIHDFPDRYTMFRQRQATVGKRSLSTVNGFLGAYPGAEGMKTGFTCGSGYNIIASALHGDRRLVAVLLGAQDRNQRAGKIKKLLDSGFAGGETVPATFANIAMVPAALDAGAPPTVLSGSECAATDSSADADGTSGSGKLPGWGIIFGAFPNAGKAQQTISDMKQKMKGELKGRPTVVQRQYEGSKKFAALMVGLGSEDAGRICRMIWHRGQYCLALNPVVLNDPNALWR